MQVSVWQQFSSNHSASFTVVGAFETQERAQAVADEVRVMISEIADWWQAYPTWEEQDEVEGNLEEGALTPPEEKYREHYHLARTHWPTPLDWTRTPNAVNAVHSVENLVIVDQMIYGGDTWNGPFPFSDILRVLGAKVASSYENGPEIVMNLHCTAPNETTAQQIVEESKDKWETQRNLAGVLPDGYIIRREGRQVWFDHFWQWYEPSLDQTLARLLSDLREKGCTDIEYEFVEDSGS